MLIRWSVILLCFIILTLYCFILQVAIVRINWMCMIYWSGDASSNVLLCFHVVLLYYCFITSLFHSIGCQGEHQLDAHDIIYWSGDPSFNVMMCFHVVLLFYCFITSLFHSTGCHGEDQFGCSHALCSKASFNLTNRFYQFKILWIQQFELFTTPIQWVATYCSGSSVNYYHFRHSSQHCLVSPWVDSCPNIVAITLSSLGAHYFLHSKVLSIHPRYCVIIT